MLPQCGENVVAAVVDGGERRALAHDLVETKLDRRRRHEALIDENVHGVRVVHREQLHLIGVRGFPELLGELHDVPTVPRLQCRAGNPQELSRRTGRRVHRRAVVVAAHEPHGHA